MNDDGLDGIVIAEFLESGHDHVLGSRMTPSSSTTPILSPKLVSDAPLAAGMQREIDQRKHGQSEEEESSATNEDPEPGAGTAVLSHKVAVV